jgi:hypothetical protein
VELVFKSSMKGMICKESTQKNFVLDKMDNGVVTIWLSYTVSGLSIIGFISVSQGDLL